MLVNSPNDIPTWLSGWFAALNQGQSRVTSIQSAEIKGNTCKWRHHVPANMLWSMSRLRTWHPGHSVETEHPDQNMIIDLKKNSMEHKRRRSRLWRNRAGIVNGLIVLPEWIHISRPIKRMLYSLQNRRWLSMFWLNCDYMTCHRLRDITKVKFK